MNAAVFADTSAFLALRNAADLEQYPVARGVVENLRANRVPLLTTDYVLDEAYTLLRSVLGHRTAVAFGREIREGGITIVQVDPGVQADAWRIFERYEDKEFSFTDCTSFVVMRRANLSAAFTFDRHFQQYVFETLPSELPVRRG